MNLDNITKEEVNKVNFIIKQHSLHNAPRNAAELHKCIQVIFGVTVPYTACSENTVAPFEWIYDLYFERTSKSMAVGGRGTSKTYGASKLHFLKNTFYPNYSTRHASATLEQAGVCQGYLEKFSSDPNLRSILTSSPSKKEARWKNGSQWRIVTGSFKGVCLSPWTSINTDKGTIPIKKIFESKQEYKALSFNTTTNEFEYKKIVGKHNNGAGGVFYKINTQYQLTSVSPAYTANHEVYVSGNVKKQVGQLTSEDSILVKGYKFSKDQEQVLLGTLLGDSSIDKSGRLTYAHGLPQEYYGDWKANVFSDIIQRKYAREGGFGTECKFYRFFKTIELLKLRDTMYPQGKKVVTYEYLCKLNFLGLAVWFMDDGSRSKNSITFNTQGFDDDSVDIIVKFFNDNGFNAKKRLDSNKQYVVVFDVKSSVKFLRHIAFYIHYDEEGKNKQWVAKPIKSDGREALHEIKVESVEKTELLDTTRYDITVEDNHNYVLSNGQLVSNSGQHPRALYLDEIETWKIEDIEQTWAVPLAGDGHVAGWHGFSTRQRAFGAANWLTEVAADRGIKTYTWTIFETLQRCKTCVAIDQHPHGTDEQRQVACNLWEDCIHEDELVSTVNRGMVKIKDVTTDDIVYSWSEGILRENKVSRVWSKGVKPIYTIKTNSGRTIRVTENHPVLVVREKSKGSGKRSATWEYVWVNAGALKVKDLVVSVKSLTNHNKDLEQVASVPITDDLLWLVGTYVGDGVLESQYKISIAEFNTDKQNRIRNIAQNLWGANCNLNKRAGIVINSKVGNRTFRELDLSSGSSSLKSMPEWVWKLSNRQIRVLLEGYLSADGCVNISKQGTVTHNFAATSEKLIRQISELYRYVDIGTCSAVRKVERTKPIYISGKLVQNAKPLYTLQCHVNSKKRNVTIYDDTSVGNLLSPDDEVFKFEVIKDIAITSSHEVYDITVENDHNLIVNGIVVHNCHGCRGTKSTGWVQLAHAQELKSTMSRSSWLTQALCEKPSTHGLVLHNFEHMGRIQGGNLTAFTYQENLPLYCCHDPAEGAESCLYYIQIIDDCVYVFDELVQNPCANTSITKMAFYEHNMKRGYKDPTLIIVDPRKTDAIEDWKLGIPNGEGIGRSYKAVGSPMDRAHGGQQIADNIEYLRTLIQDGNNIRRLYVNHKQCPKLIQGIKEYHYPMNNNNEQTSDTPSKEYSDRIDPLRYFAQWHKTINSRNAKNVFRIH